MRDASFHLLDRAAWPRSEHFDYYIRTVKCRYDLTAHLTVTALRGAVKEWMERYQVPAYGEEDGTGLVQ